MLMCGTPCHGDNIQHIAMFFIVDQAEKDLQNSLKESWCLTGQVELTWTISAKVLTVS